MHQLEQVKEAIELFVIEEYIFLIIYHTILPIPKFKHVKSSIQSKSLENLRFNHVGLIMLFFYVASFSVFSTDNTIIVIVS